MTSKGHGGRKSGKLLNRRMMHTAATLHYVEGLSQVEVSRRMQVSTATTSRLLGMARNEGIVRIRVMDLDEFGDMGDSLSAALKLKHVEVTESGQAAALGAHVGALLHDARLAHGSVIGIGWGRTIQSILSAGLPKVAGVVVVPMIGGMHMAASHFQINEFVRMAAEQTGGTARFLYAPSMVSPELHSVLVRDPQMAQVIALWDRVEVAIVGIGAVSDDAKLAGIGFSGDELGRVVGDVMRHYFDREGREIRWPGQENQMSIARAQLERIPLSVGVAMGRDKASSIIGAARSGMINALVTDTVTASEILMLLEEGDA